jgi:phage terminase Nu1 subunit (DNA packaging protein)
MKVSQQALASLLSVNAKTVREWNSQGLPRDDAGQYDLRLAIRWRIALERERFEEKKDIATATARFRLAKAQAAEADLAERTGELVSLDVVKDAILPVLNASRAYLLRLPRTAAPSLAHCDAKHIEARLSDMIRVTLEDLAEMPARVAAEGKKRRKKRSRARALSAEPAE